MTDIESGNTGTYPVPRVHIVGHRIRVVVVLVSAMLHIHFFHNLHAIIEQQFDEQLTHRLLVHITLQSVVNLRFKELVPATSVIKVDDITIEYATPMPTSF